LGAGHLKLADFESLLERNPQIAHVELSNYGEMFLNPDLAGILACAFEHKVTVSGSNGANLNFAREDDLDALVRYRVRALTCSIDGATQETYSRYRVNGNLEPNRETCYFLKMYLRAVRAVDYITSHPDWDGKTLLVMGTCMGGQQALVGGALRAHQVTAVIANQPSGADLNGDLHGRKTGYPYWPASDPYVMATAPSFDIVNFAPRITAPVLASMGFIDTTSPPAGIWTVLNQLSGPKEVVTMIELDYTSRTPERRGAFRARAAEVLNALLNQAPA